MRIDAEQHPAFANIGLGDEVDPAALADHLFPQRQLIQFEAIHPDIELRQQRRIRVAGTQLGKSRQLAAMENQLADIEPAFEPRERPPLQVGLGDHHEYAVGIAQDNIVQGGFVEDRSLDPPDLDFQARTRRQLGDPVDHEAVADLAIEQQDQREHADHRGRQQRRAAGNHIAPPVAPGRAGRGRGFAGQRVFCLIRFGGAGNLVGHQNAWPSAT